MLQSSFFWEACIRYSPVIFLAVGMPFLIWARRKPEAFAKIRPYILCGISVVLIVLALLGHQQMPAIFSLLFALAAADSFRVRAGRGVIAPNEIDLAHRPSD